MSKNLAPRIALSILVTMACTSALQAQEANYDESKVPQYTLPDLLICSDGTKVADADTWRQKRRPEILKLFEEHMFGKAPGKPQLMTFMTTSVNKNALDGQATRKEVVVYFTGREQDPNMTILLYLPNKGPKPVPLFVGLNFQGNHAIHTDPGITITKSWMRSDGNHRATARLAGQGGQPLAGRANSRTRLRPGDDLLRRHRSRTSTTVSRTAFTPCSTKKARPSPPRMSGAPSRPGPGA